MNKRAHRMALVGALSQVVLYAGILAASYFAKLAVGGMNFSGVDDVKAIISQVNQTTHLLSRALDLLHMATLIAIGGLALFTVAVVRYQYRRRWAFWFMLLHGGVVMLFAPFGILYGSFLVIYALSRHREFRGKIPVAVLCPEPPAGGEVGKVRKRGLETLL